MLGNNVYEKFYERYPDLFRRKTLEPSESCMYWGITCGYGWCALLDKLCVNLEKLFRENNLTGDKYPAVEQVKEKYGTLRFYIDFMPGTDKVIMEKAHAFIREAEKESEVTCDVCGGPGELRGGSWIVCRCDKHVKGITI